MLSIKPHLLTNAPPNTRMFPSPVGPAVSVQSPSFDTLWRLPAEMLTKQDAEHDRYDPASISNTFTGTKLCRQPPVVPTSGPCSKRSAILPPVTDLAVRHTSRLPGEGRPAEACIASAGDTRFGLSIDTALAATLHRLTEQANWYKHCSASHRC